MSKLEDLENKVENLFEQIYGLKADIKKFKEENESEILEKFDPFKHMTGFLNGEIAINCKTEESADELTQILGRLGLTWKYSRGMSDTAHWFINGEDTCYSIINNYLNYSSIRYHEENGIKIVEFE